MKLTTRLALVVTAILTAATVVTSAQALIASRDSKLSTYYTVLDSLANDLKNTKDDPTSLALLTAENSPIPMSLAFVTNNDISFLTENAGSEFKLPTSDQFKIGLQKTIQITNHLTRFHAISNDEYLVYFLPTDTLQREFNQSLKSALFFNLLIILLGALIVTLLFRRDSKLNSAARQMQEFIGDASHELKTPLTVIRGYSEMLTSNPNKVSEYSARINSESIRMTNIIDKLLKIAALDEGSATESVELDLAEYLQKYVNDFKVLEPLRPVELSANTLKITAPYELIDTLISNLMSNVRIHTPIDAPLRITLKDRNLIIEDGGPGLKVIPDKPFQRFDQSRSRESGGSGLGMTLIQKSAKQLGVKMEFGKSELGGLKVSITF